MRRQFLYNVDVGNVEEVKVAIEAGVDVNMTTVMGVWTIGPMVEKPNVEISNGENRNCWFCFARSDDWQTEMMHTAGVPDTDCSVLLMAILNGHFDVARLLVEAGADVCATTARKCRFPLLAAAWRGNSAMIDCLLAAGANVNQARSDDYSEFTPDNGIGFTALMAASREGHLDAIKTLLAAGANVNQARSTDGYTALVWASRFGHVDAIEMLLAAGANINQCDAGGGDIALICASENGHVDAMETLLAAGANVNQGDKNGCTALMRASSAGHIDAIKTLLAAGANVNQTVGISGYNALIAALYSTRAGRADLIKALLAAGANVNQRRTDNGHTALIIASEHGLVDAIKVLKEAGAEM